MIDLDDFDRRLLALVRHDNLQPARILADKVGLSLSAVLRRLRRMREEKVIIADIAVVDPAGGKVVASIPTDHEATHMVAVRNDGRMAFTSNIRSGTVSVVDLKLGKKLRDIAVGGEPEGIALSREEQVIWVADLKGARVQAFDAESLDKIGEVATGPVPIRVAASPDGRWIVTSNVGDGSLTLIDAASRKKVRDLAVSGTQEAGQVTILFAPDGRLYAAETGRNAVAEIDLGTGKVLRRLPAGTNGDGLAIAPASLGN